MKKFKYGALLLLLICAIFGIGIIAFNNPFHLIGLGRPANQFRTSSETVVQELRQLQRLETAAFTIEKVIEAGTAGNVFQEVLYGDRLLLIAHGQVIAGFDLAKLDDNAVKINTTDNSIELTLPPPEILITTLDNTETRVYDRQRGLLSQGDKDLETQARQVAERSIQQAACDSMILEKASDNGRQQLTTLLRALGFANVHLEIPNASCAL